jgi:hypothetical protein
MAAIISNKQRVCASTGIPRDRASKSREWASRQKKQINPHHTQEDRESQEQGNKEQIDIILALMSTSNDKCVADL